MKYKELEKLNEIIEILKAVPNVDNNIQFLLTLAEQSGKAEVLEELIQNKVLKNEQNTVELEQAKKANFGLKFTNEEIRQMPKTFRNELRIEGCTCKLRLRRSGKYKETYELRYRRNGYNISACGKTREAAKSNFIKKLKTAKPTKKSVVYSQDFCAFTEYYFENFRKKKVTETTYKNDERRYNNYLKPAF